MLTLAYLVLIIVVMVKAIRYGRENETLTNITIVVGIITCILSAVFSFISYQYIAALFSIGLLVFTFFLKKMITFFVDDYDKKHQISVDVAERNQSVDDGLDDAFWNGDDRFKNDGEDFFQTHK